MWGPFFAHLNDLGAQSAFGGQRPRILNVLQNQERVLKNEELVESPGGQDGLNQARGAEAVRPEAGHLEERGLCLRVRVLGCFRLHGQLGRATITRGSGAGTERPRTRGETIHGLNKQDVRSIKSG